MAMKVLLVEDGGSTVFSIELMLRSENMIFHTLNYGDEGLNIKKFQTEKNDYDIIILDLTLPDVGNMDIIKRIRATGIKTPILIISGFNTVNQKIGSLISGADDYLTKPFSKNELVTRIKAIVKRADGKPESIIKTGLLSINIRTNQVRVREDRVSLTGKEYMILELLALRKGSALSKEVLLNHLYSGIDEPALKIIDVFICKLRRKLEKLLPKGDKYIDTIWGRGYVLRDIPLNQDSKNYLADTHDMSASIIQ